MIRIKSRCLQLVLCLIILVVAATVFLFSASNSGADIKEKVLLSTTNSSSCNYDFGKTFEEDLRKIDSLEFPEAKPYLQNLFPKDFKVKDAKHHVGGVQMDPSLPSIPTLIFRGLLVTGSSPSHFLESMELVSNIKNVVRPAYKDIKFYYYDLGLTTKQRNKLTKVCECEVISFPFDEFPPHVRIMKGYAWKPLVIQLTLKKHGFVFWLDSSIRFKTGNLDWLFKQAQSLGILAIVGQAPIASRTQKATFEILQEQPCLYRTKKTKEFQSGFTIVYATDFVMQYVMLPWVSCALTNDCLVPYISPEKYLGCFHAEYYHDCHRFDQSILSLLMTRLFHNNLESHTLNYGGKKAFFQICKGGDELPFVPDFLNKIIVEYQRTCY